ncbi:LeuA family protein [Haliangium sp.]|uniref:LeuA family protein n=1 Tax=Haliangium sp. TaxID=2663208 RepID=UPI003D106F7A
MDDPTHESLIHDWNHDPAPGFAVQLNDETLRDGLQSPSARDPTIDRKLALIALMNDLGIDTANVGLPGASARATEHVRTLCREMLSMKITPNVACRTVISDIAPAAQISQEMGAPIEVCAFIGSSAIRQYAEGWSLDRMLGLVREAIGFCAAEGLPSMFVTEDTTRARPEHLRALYSAAVEAGARRICVCDTCGHATPSGVRRLIGFVKEVVSELGAAAGVDVGIDWHGHRDRGLGLANAIAAVEAGATRIHGSAMGVGERTGNVEMDLLLVNLKLMGWIERDLHRLGEYMRLASEAVDVPIPANYPVFGVDAFETATGVHAAAVIKAFRMDDGWLANRVYSGVPADWFGLEQQITVGPMSGKSNIIWVLEKHGVEATDERVTRVFRLAKQSSRLLTDDEVIAAAVE